jgi:hypothetical protein
MNNITKIKRPRKYPVIAHKPENDSDIDGKYYDYTIYGNFLLGHNLKYKSEFSFDMVNTDAKIEDLHELVHNSFMNGKMELTTIIKRDASIRKNVEVYKSMPENTKIPAPVPKKKTFWQNLWTNY